MTKNTKTDHVDKVRAQWAKEMPGLDTAPMAVIGRINRIARLVDPMISAIMEKQDLDRGEFDVLATLLRSGAPYELSPTALYRSLMLSSGGLTSRLQKLEQKGLIARKDSADDKRSQLVILTSKGKERCRAALLPDMALEKRLLSALNTAQLKMLETILRELSHALEMSDQFSKQERGFQ